MACTFLGLALLAGVARAESAGQGRPGAFALLIESCPSIEEAAVRHTLLVEVGDLLLDDREPAPGADRLRIRCTGDVARLEAGGGDGALALSRSIELADFPGDTTARAVALAGLELLAARSPEVRASIQERQVPPPQPASPPLARGADPVARTARDLRIGLGGVWRTFLVSHGVSAWGAQAQVIVYPTARLRVPLDVEVSGARTEIEGMGRTEALLVSCGAGLGVGIGGPRFGAGLTAGGRLGIARLSGATSRPNEVADRSVVRAWGGPAVSASLGGASETFAWALTAEAGRAVLAAEGLADRATAIAIRGFWVAISLVGSLRLQ